MKQVQLLIDLSRIREYYGTVILTTVFGLVMSSDPHLTDSVILIFSNILCTAFIFGFNDLEDATDDELDDKKRNRNTISSKRLSKKDAKYILTMFFISALVLYLQINLLTFVVGALGLIFGLLYSWSVVRLKSVPILDLLTHGYFFGLLYFLVPITAFGSNNYYLTAWYSICIYLQSIMVDINNEVRDMELDKKNKLRNTLIYFKLYKLEKYMISLWSIVVGLFLLPVIVSKTSESMVVLTLVGLVAILIYKLKDKFVSNRFSFPRQQRLLLGISIIVIIFV